MPVTVAQLLELELAGWIAAVPRRLCPIKEGKPAFDVLMYLFETYIHSRSRNARGSGQTDAGSYRCGF
ncbi:hypothetical protein LNQ52_11785 [Klebsiella pneumoniae subsp. pneumoniae]|nr:hypothetical protein [Klebsiella pneumoniae subsp. pneumoniae]